MSTIISRKKGIAIYQKNIEHLFGKLQPLCYYFYPWLLYELVQFFASVLLDVIIEPKHSIYWVRLNVKSENLTMFSGTLMLCRNILASLQHDLQMMAKKIENLSATGQ